MVKAYVGFSLFETNPEICHNFNVISTGNWGCGMFGGEPQIKSMLQWIVATICNKKIIYYTFKVSIINKYKCFLFFFFLFENREQRYFMCFCVFFSLCNFTFVMQYYILKTKKTKTKKKDKRVKQLNDIVTAMQVMPTHLYICVCDVFWLLSLFLFVANFEFVITNPTNNKTKHQKKEKKSENL